MTNDIVPVGKDTYRVTIASKALRVRFEDQPGFQVTGDRVYFKKELLPAMRKLMDEPDTPKRRATPAHQMSLAL